MKLAAFSLTAPDHEHQHKVILNANEDLHFPNEGEINFEDSLDARRASEV